MVFIKSHKEELSLEGDALPLKSHEITGSLGFQEAQGCWERAWAEVETRGQVRCAMETTPCWASMDCKGGKQYGWRNVWDLLKSQEVWNVILQVVHSKRGLYSSRSWCRLVLGVGEGRNILLLLCTFTYSILVLLNFHGEGSQVVRWWSWIKGW